MAGFLNKSLGHDLSLVPDANFKVLVSVLTLLQNRLSWQNCLDLGFSLETFEKLTVLVSVLVILWAVSWYF